MFGFFKRRTPKPEPMPAPQAPVLSKPVLPPVPVPAPVLKATAATPDDGFIPVPFPDIFSRLGGALAPLPTAQVTGSFPLPVSSALKQLPTGVVRVRFAQIRQAAPSGTFGPDTSLDDTLVELPLSKIIAAMNPALMARRAGQSRVEVPADVSGVFGPKSTHIAPTPVTAPLPAPIPPLVSAPVAPFRAPAPIPALVPAAASIPIVSAPMALGDGVTVKLSSIYEMWPEPVRQEISQSRWNEASVSLPMNRLEAAMKTGRVTFPWGDLSQWLDAPPPSAPSPNRETYVELPLKVIAPLFLSHRKSPGAQTKLVVAENLPDVFNIAGQTAAPTIPVPPAPLAPVALPVPPPTPAPLLPPASVLGDIFGQPTKKDWSPAEIAQKVGSLPGVVGSLIAMSDGLLVAGQLPAPLKSETMAAFLPQLFGRLAHYSTEIQLGQLNAVTLQAGTVPCIIFKTGTTYLAVLGKSGEPLPGLQLQRIAAELAKISQ
jgi:predicted regulator of Ras-like GTPase activity (Roadblock/LC7/MglB family)